MITAIWVDELQKLREVKMCRENETAARPCGNCLLLGCAHCRGTPSYYLKFYECIKSSEEKTMINEQVQSAQSIDGGRKLSEQMIDDAVEQLKKVYTRLGLYDGSYAVQRLEESRMWALKKING